MKKRITKIWSVGLVVVLATSLLLMAAPASAGTLGWTVSTDIPDTTDKVVQDGTNLTDMAVSADGQTIYVASGTAILGMNNTGTNYGSAAWSTAQAHTGSNSALLTVGSSGVTNSIYAEFVPDVDMTFAQFEADIQAATNTWGWWNYIEAVAGNHAQIEVKFTDPGSTDYIDIMFVQHNVTGGAAWAQVSMLTATVSWQAWGPTLTGSGANKNFTTLIATNALGGGNYDLYELSRVRIELNEGTPARYSYVDDVIIAGTTYNLEPSALYKSTDGGGSFSTVTLPSSLSQVNLVAMPPDDDDIVVIAGDANNLEASVSVNGGSTWSSLGTIQDNGGTAAAAVYDLEISALSGSARYIAAPGTEGVDEPGLYYFNFGSTVGKWEDACDDFNTPFVPATNLDIYDGSIDKFRSVAFSPSFPSDQVMVAVSEQVGEVAGSEDGAVRFHIASFNQEKWDAEVFSSYPVLLEGTTDLHLDVNAADISLDPEYLGGDDTTRIAFVGLSVTKAAEAGGVYRLKNVTLEPEKEAVGINSVAWDGENMAAGAYLTNDVFRSDDALASSPTYDTSRSYKEIGVDDTLANDQMVVRWGGDGTLLGVKQGLSSAFSRSTDNGKVWNDIALIDTTLSVMEDVWVSPDGSVTYLLTQDTDDTVTMLWKKASAWERIFCVANVAGHIVRAADSDADVVYIADIGNGCTDMYYSSNGGTEKWFVRASRYDIADLAVQDADVAYVANFDNDEVSTTTNGGFTWGSDIDSKSAGGVCATLTLIAEDQLLLGTSTGYVSYSSDGNGSWTKITPQLEESGAAQVTASGLATGDFIYAATAGANTEIERWEIGQSGTTWKDLAAPVTTSYGCFGLILNEGALYAVTANTTAANNSELQRTLDPASSTPAASKWVTVASADESFNTAPSAMRLSTGSTILWAIDTVAAGLWSFTDTLATGLEIELVAPVEGYQNPVNTVSGASQDISFKWNRPSAGTAAVAYEVRIKAADGSTTLQTGTRAATDSAAPNLLMGPNQESVEAIQFAPGQTYYWQVRATTPVDSPWTALRSFTIEPGIALVPDLLSPANGSDTVAISPSFSWEPIAGATEYQFKLASTVSLSPSIIDLKVKSTGFEVTKELEEGKTYYWAVKPIAPVEGGWSAVANFTVKVPAPAPAPPVVVKEVPAPVINIPAAPAPPPAIVIPPAPAPPAPIAPAYIWAIIIIGAVLIIAVIVLVIRTRRVV